MQIPHCGQPAHRVLIAVGNAGRQLLSSNKHVNLKFDQSILLARPVVGAPQEPADKTVHYVSDSAGACRQVVALARSARSVAIVGAGGGRTTSLILLRLAGKLAGQRAVEVVLITPFSWEDRRHQWRALYVRFRLRQLIGVNLAVVVTGRIEQGMRAETPMDEVFNRVMGEAWERL